MKTNEKDIPPEKEKREPLQRRLDSLARLLEGSSMCAAVSIINGAIYVSSNALFDGTRRNQASGQMLAQTIKIMKYFKSVAKNKLKDEDQKSKRKELMISILKSQINAESHGFMMIPDDVIEKVINIDTLTTDSPYPSNKDDTYKFLKKHEDKTHMAFGYGKRLYKTFFKIERSLEEETDKKVEKKFSLPEISAFKNFKQENNILFLPKDKKEGEKKGKDVHAEMQILDKIIELLENSKIKQGEKIYIGISKKCCFHCHLLLKISKEEIWRQYKVSIEFGGAHDQPFEDNWGRPPFLKTGTSPLIKRILKKYKAAMHDVKVPKASKYDQRHSPSASGSSIGQDIKSYDIESYRNNLFQEYTVLKKYGLENTDPAKVLLAIVELYENGAFKLLFTPERFIGNKERFINNLIDHHRHLHLKGEITEESLTNFLKNSSLSGKRISDFFNGIEETSFSQDLGFLEDVHTSPDENFNYSDFQEGEPHIYSIKDQTYKLKPTAGDGDCFFHAVDILNFNRTSLVERLIDNAHKKEVRDAFAHEIFQFLYSGHTKDNAHPGEEQVAFNKLLTKEIIDLFITFDAAEQNPSKETQIEISEEPLKEYEIRDAIYEYCSREDVFKNYVNYYLKDARGYIPFPRGLGDEIPNTIFDIINQLFELKIQVYLASDKSKDQLKLINKPEEGHTIPIIHDGNQHFLRLELSSPEPKEEIQDKNLLPLYESRKRKNISTDSTETIDLENPNKRLKFSKGSKGSKGSKDPERAKQGML